MSHKLKSKLLLTACISFACSISFASDVRLIEPVGPLTTNNPNYEWQSFAEADWYNLIVKDDDGNKINEWFSSEEANCETPGAVCDVTPAELVNGNAEWYVQAWGHNQALTGWGAGKTMSYGSAQTDPLLAYYADEHDPHNRLLAIDTDSMQLIDETAVPGSLNHHADPIGSVENAKYVFLIPKNSKFINVVDIKTRQLVKTINLPFKPRSADAYNASKNLILLTAANRPAAVLFDVETLEIVGRAGFDIQCGDLQSTATAATTAAVLPAFPSSLYSLHSTASSSSTPTNSLGTNLNFELPRTYWRTYRMLSPSKVPGWKTFNDKRIEIWARGFANVKPANGYQHIELNADDASGIYQDMAVTPGSTVTLKFNHRGRNGKDTMAVQVGAGDGDLQTIGTYTTDKTSWSQYSVNYTIPQGQTNLRVYFKPIETAKVVTKVKRWVGYWWSGRYETVVTTRTDNSQGNFLDNVQITSTPGSDEVLCLSADFGGTQISGHPIWLNDDVFAIVDRTNRRIHTYHVERDNKGGWDISKRGTLDGPTSIHQLVPRDRTGLSEYERDMYYGVLEGNQQTGEEPGLIKIWLDPNGAPHWEGYLRFDEQNASISGGHNADFHPDNRHLYIGVASGNIYVIDTDTMKVKTVIPAQRGTGHTVFMKGRDLAVATNHLSDKITIINTENHTKIKDIQLPFNKEGISSVYQSHTGYSSDDGKYYYNFWTDGGVFFRIDMDTLTLDDSVYTGGVPIQGSFFRVSQD